MQGPIGLSTNLVIIVFVLLLQLLDFWEVCTLKTENRSFLIDLSYFNAARLCQITSDCEKRGVIRA